MAVHEGRFAAMQASSPEGADVVLLMARCLLEGGKLIPWTIEPPAPGSAAAELEAMIVEATREIPSIACLAGDPKAEAAMCELVCVLLSCLSLRVRLHESAVEVER